ncbi:MAG: glycosyltransferase family 1 protein [Gammaproteobacteria bacterium]
MKALLLCETPSASVDYYLMPELSHQGYQIDVKYLADPTTEITAEDVSLLVVCRYLNAHWAQRLRTLRTRGVPVVYFLDDDLFDPRAWRGLPWRYRVKLCRLGLRWRSWVSAYASQVWVSTPYLAQKYSGFKPIVLTPAFPKRRMPIHRIVYHGTASHYQEHRWLIPILQDIQRHHRSTLIEVFADSRLKKLYRAVPRTLLIHPTSWASYACHTRSCSASIGLAPLLPSAFNAARGPTKYFDYARVGAVGIYSARPPYMDFVRDGEDGLLLPDEPERWVNAILALLESPHRLAAMRSAIEQKLAYFDLRETGKEERKSQL